MGNFYNDVKKYQKEILLGLSAAVLFIVVKYVVVYILPFLFAGIFVFLIRRPIDFIHKKTKIGKGFLAGMSALFLILILGMFIWYGSCLCMEKMKNLIMNPGSYENQFCSLVKNCCDAMESNLGINSLTIETLILERVDIFIDNLKIDVVPKLLNHTVLYGKLLFRGVMFILVTVIAVILLAKDYEWMLIKAKKVRLFGECVEMLQKLIFLIGGYVRAQIEIILIISLICFLGFVLSGYTYPYIWGIVTGLLDMLPFVGTGVTLLPLALLQFLMGNEANAVILVITFIASALARELLEPKLIGARMGVIPIVILIAVYVGAKVFGITGVVWGPLYMLMLYEIYKKLYGIEG